MKQEILDRLNELIVEERGVPLSINDNWVDANMDSLGTMIIFAILDSEYNIFKDIPESEDVLSTIDFKTLTVRDIIRKCILSSTDTSQEPKNKTNSSLSQNSTEKN